MISLVAKYGIYPVLVACFQNRNKPKVEVIEIKHLENLKKPTTSSTDILQPSTQIEEPVLPRSILTTFIVNPPDIPPPPIPPNCFSSFKRQAPIIPFREILKSPLPIHAHLKLINPPIKYQMNKSSQFNPLLSLNKVPESFVDLDNEDDLCLFKNIPYKRTVPQYSNDTDVDIGLKNSFGKVRVESYYKSSSSLSSSNLPPPSIACNSNPSSLNTICGDLYNVHLETKSKILFLSYVILRLKYPKAHIALLRTSV